LEKAGFPEGKSDDFWRQAEIELDAEGETNEPTTVPLLQLAYKRSQPELTTPIAMAMSAGLPMNSPEVLLRLVQA
jgi:hypothetical protein